MTVHPFINKDNTFRNRWTLVSKNPWKLSGETFSRNKGEAYYNALPILKSNEITKKLPYEFLEVYSKDINFLNSFKDINNRQFFISNNFHPDTYSPSISNRLNIFGGEIDSFIIDLKDGLIDCKIDDELVKHWVIKVLNKEKTNFEYYRLSISLKITPDNLFIEIDCNFYKLKAFNLLVFTSNFSLLLSLIIIFLNQFEIQFFPISDFIYISITTWLGQIIYRSFVTKDTIANRLYQLLRYKRNSSFLFYKCFLKKHIL